MCLCLILTAKGIYSNNGYDFIKKIQASVAFRRLYTQQKTKETIHLIYLEFLIIILQYCYDTLEFY